MRESDALHSSSRSARFQYSRSQTSIDLAHLSAPSLHQSIATLRCDYQGRRGSLPERHQTRLMTARVEVTFMRCELMRAVVCRTSIGTTHINWELIGWYIVGVVTGFYEHGNACDMEDVFKLWFDLGFSTLLVK